MIIIPAQSGTYRHFKVVSPARVRGRHSIQPLIEGHLQNDMDGMNRIEVDGDNFSLADTSSSAWPVVIRALEELMSAS
jgi:hypothetical protein